MRRASTTCEPRSWRAVGPGATEVRGRRGRCGDLPDSPGGRPGLRHPGAAHARRARAAGRGPRRRPGRGRPPGRGRAHPGGVGPRPPPGRPGGLAVGARSTPTWSSRSTSRPTTPATPARWCGWPTSTGPPTTASTSRGATSASTTTASRSSASSPSGTPAPWARRSPASPSPGSSRTAWPATAAWTASPSTTPRPSPSGCPPRPWASTIVSVSRLEANKRPGPAPRRARPPRPPRCPGVLAGTGQPGRRAAARAGPPGLDDRLEMPGYVSDDDLVDPARPVPRRPLRPLRRGLRLRHPPGLPGRTPGDHHRGRRWGARVGGRRRDGPGHRRQPRGAWVPRSTGWPPTATWPPAWARRAGPGPRPSGGPHVVDRLLAAAR